MTTFFKRCSPFGNRSSWAILALLVTLLTAACGGTEEALPDLAPDEILRNSAEAMRELDGFHFAIDRDGALAYLDPSQTLAFGSGSGDYVAPDRARAVVSIIAPGLITKVSVISVGAVQWETNVVTGVWSELPPDWGFNPTVIFDADIGLQAILTEDTSNLARLEPETLDDGPDTPLYVVSGDLSGERVHQMSGLLIGPDPLTFTMWVNPNTFELVRVVVNDPPDANSDVEEASVWQIDFSKFGETVDIEPPAIE